jgi:hypothetical protein
LRKRKQPIVVQQSDLRETEKTLLSRTDLQINRNRNEKNTSELVCISKRNFEWEKEPYHTRMSRRKANATNSDAETTTATDCWSQKAVPEKWLQISAGAKN